jgi:hypothetical protein
MLKSKDEARILAEQHLHRLGLSLNVDLVFLDEYTKEADFGWVFYWNSKKYRETGMYQHALGGNGPLIVDRQDGSIHETSSAEPIEAAMEDYRKYRSRPL